MNYISSCLILLQNPPDWTEILNHFRGSELQNYFTKILEDDIKALIKPQYVDQIPKAVKGTVGQLLKKKNERDNLLEICQLLGNSIIFFLSWSAEIVIERMLTPDQDITGKFVSNGFVCSLTFHASCTSQLSQLIVKSSFLAVWKTEKVIESVGKFKKFCEKCMSSFSPLISFEKFLSALFYPLNPVVIRPKNRSHTFQSQG